MKSSPVRPVEATKINYSRRHFVTGIAAGGVLGGLGLLSNATARTVQQSSPGMLSGTQFDLKIGVSAVNFTGRPGLATTINGRVPGPVLRWREGEPLTLRVHNSLSEPTSIHWHGIILPPEMDGVPGISFRGIEPGETFTYRFTPQQSGTYWYHSHSGFQEQLGHYGSIVIEPREPEPYSYQRDYVVVLSDWTDENPDRVFSKLKKHEGYYNYSQLTMADFMRQVREEGFEQAFAFRSMWDRMRMNPRDLADVSAATYTFLMNGTPPDGNWTGLFRTGEKIRLRLVNAAAMTYFDLRIPGLRMTVVAADGLNVHPVSVEELRIGVAETYDVIVEPDQERAYTIYAQSADRSGFARGSLAPRIGMSAPVPEPDPVPTLTMADMGMSHGMHGQEQGAMNHGKATSGKAMRETMNHAGMGQTGKDVTAMNHAEMASSAKMKENPDHAGKTQGGRKGSAMNHTGKMSGSMEHSAPPTGKQPGMSTNSDHAEMRQDSHKAQSMNHGKMTHRRASLPSHAHRTPPGAGGGLVRVARHPAEEFGPAVDMRAELVSNRLDDPGVGLRDNGRRVLTYADLKSLQEPVDRRPPGRTIELHLTGNMERYMWSFDGVRFSEAEPIRLRHGEMVRLRLVNDTMMEHPIHLHGLWSDIETPAGEFLVRKHTVSVKPGQMVSFRVLADALGEWAFHCHLIYHMKAGMFRKVVVA